MSKIQNWFIKALVVPPTVVLYNENDAINNYDNYICFTFGPTSGIDVFRLYCKKKKKNKKKT